MRLYSGSSQQFIKDAIRNQIADKLKSAFFDYFRYNPSPGEMNSWRNSLRAMSQVIQYAGLEDNGVLLEYQLPQSSKRLDCMLTGQGSDASDNAIIVELNRLAGNKGFAIWHGGHIRNSCTHAAWSCSKWACPSGPLYVRIRALGKPA